MDKELQKKLKEKYPIIFSGMVEKSDDCRWPLRIECGDGWFNLIDELCSKIEPLAEQEKILARKIMLRDMLRPPDGDLPPPRAVQIKSKFGELRFYMSWATEEMYALIHDTEEKSHFICESCGEKQETKSNKWDHAVCNECWAKTVTLAQ